MFVEIDVGMGIGFINEDYVVVGVEILLIVVDVFVKVEMIVKVKEF